MPFLIFFFLISLPVLEVASIVEVSRWIGPLATFLLLAASAALGIVLIRSQSLTVGRRMMEAMRTGAPPERTLLDSGTITFAGVLLMIPGFITDVLALILLIPSARQWIWRGMSFGMRGSVRSWRARAGSGADAQRDHPEGDVIDVEYSEVPKDAPAGPSGMARGDSPWTRP